MSLYEALQDIYKKYGYSCEKTISIVMPGKDGMEKMSALMKSLRTSPLKNIAGMDILSTTDYQEQTITDKDSNVTPYKDLPVSNVLKYNLDDGKTQFIIRPSGTEPKIKFYLSTSADSMEKAENLVNKVLDDIKKQLGV